MTKFKIEALGMTFTPQEDITPMESVRFTQLLTSYSINPTITKAELEEFIYSNNLGRHFK